MTLTTATVASVTSEITALIPDADPRLYDLLEALTDAARKDGAEDIVIDLEDAGELTDTAREFLDANNGIRVR